MGEQHTPGPWIDGGSLLGSARLITNQNVAQIACVYGVRPKRESAANTRLIAAAPDYHAIAKMIDRDAGQLDAHSKEPAIISYDAIMELRDAIAKAEGRSLPSETTKATKLAEPSLLEGHSDG
ncbi:hypothetical protein GJ689_24900 [Rhodoplanes serenus]|uniref:Uncharacterized protein n=1 Tax=Rhodoplanes serenus TaxID=200615 RepID=A0A9X4XRV9_9BRAD|nr:hypothetical protein [Rhodoplanes serenus]MTW19434.1 hypothetical protein [Rhodoplanes serenus]